MNKEINWSDRFIFNILRLKNNLDEKDPLYSAFKAIYSSISDARIEQARKEYPLLFMNPEIFIVNDVYHKLEKSIQTAINQGEERVGVLRGKFYEQTLLFNEFFNTHEIERKYGKHIQRSAESVSVSLPRKLVKKILTEPNATAAEVHFHLPCKTANQLSPNDVSNANPRIINFMGYMSQNESLQLLPYRIINLPRNDSTHLREDIPIQIIEDPAQLKNTASSPVP